jgi:ParB family chromosome partitioning protein
MGDIDALVESIRELGLLQPIVVTPDFRLIAGQRRMGACCRLGMKTVTCVVAETFVDLWAQMLAEVQENTCRKRFLPSEAVSAAQDVEPLAKAAAWRRMAHKDEEQAYENFSQGGSSMEQIAKPRALILQIENDLSK